ncbi:EscU/YscU/HrcU family type III secretion system export apparatus switch protein [Candidatus Pantoea multigeneris]|uniref:EscU/YscU/HrcU family type III secretion system export apparatus switch protein n=1 Tax=Candidatus Pantoea multigeneris TaxID=2608357 RepID=A0ABX0RD62_9GAMM|nr:EscU/YscU/HrcU family type III secretion system export apparatus switch protein [Pantoea multigeneris]NIF23296.1 EscU/YscU/HrcU family type III secretion system export apparatus switch protein [Pantoea multigeneris]
MAEKNKKATPHKLKEAKRKGQVAQSQDLYKIVIFIILTECIYLTSEWIMDDLLFLLSESLSGDVINSEFFLSSLFNVSIMTVAQVIAITLSLVIVLRISCAWMQFGPLFSTHSVSPKMSNIDPFKQIKNTLSAKQFTMLLLNVIRMMIVAIIIFLLFKEILNNLIMAIYHDLKVFHSIVLATLKKYTRVISIVLCFIVLLDILIQRYFFMKQQRMSIDDIKKEYKQNEGDPLVKGQRRSLAQEWANDTPAPSVKQKSDVDNIDALLTNPTHYAIGIYYRIGITAVPVISVIAESFEAEALIKFAREKKIPVICNVQLTRRLFYENKVGDSIPNVYLRDVAMIYRQLQETNADKVIQTI